MAAMGLAMEFRPALRSRRSSSASTILGFRLFRFLMDDSFRNEVAATGIGNTPPGDLSVPVDGESPPRYPR
jgi:hypothetical protein